MVRVRVDDDSEIHPADGVTVRCSGEYEQTGDRFFPAWLEVTIEGHDGPNLFRRIEVRDGKPELVAMGWWSRPGQREIRQKDLRNAQVASLLDELYPACRQQLPPQINKITVADCATGKPTVRYEVTVDTGADPATGRRRQIRRRFATEAAARAELATVQAGVDAGVYVHSDQRTVGDACEAWLASKHSLKPSTLRGHRLKLDALVAELGHGLRRR